MTVELDAQFRFDNTFVRDLDELCEPSVAALAPAPRLLVLNDALASELGLDQAALRSPTGIAALVGNRLPAGAASVAMAYAGHQFGNYSPRLGDGRALLVGELIDTRGNRRDLHLKGSGRTPFARGGDGKAAVGPMLREYIIGEAMHALGIPTTRALAVVATGEHIRRDQPLPGAVLARVAASHLRVGTFQYAAALDDRDLLRRLTIHALARHYPDRFDADGTDSEHAIALLDAVVGAQAELVARWMLVGFIHGVMNTDNVSISGETIDYGPCAFMDAYDTSTVFSSIDQHGRYAYGQQPQITLWNLTRLAESLLPLIHDDEQTSVDMATAVLHTVGPRFVERWREGMRVKLGLGDVDHTVSEGLVDGAIELLQTQRLDLTSFFRSLSSELRSGVPERVGATSEWHARWRASLEAAGQPLAQVADAMDRVNPIYIARNHLVEDALAAASTDDDLAPLDALVDAVSRPFDERPGLERYALPAPTDFGPYRTFCGT